VKENRRGKFVRISEVSPNGQKMRIVFDLCDTAEFHEKLTELCEVYANLGPEKAHGGYEEEKKIKTESIFTDGKKYFLDLKENHRGRFLKISMTLTNNDHSQIVVPAHGIVDVRDVLTDVLNAFGRDNTKPTVSRRRINEDNTIELDGDKAFIVEVRDNARENYMRITEVCGTFDTSVTIGEQSWEEFIGLIEAAVSAPIPSKETSSQAEMTAENEQNS